MPIQVEPLDGDVEMTLGGVVSGATAVVKVQVRGAAIAFPARSFTPVVTVAAWVVRPANKADGWNVELSPSIVTVPTTELPLLSTSEKVSGVMVVPSIGSLNFALIEAFTPTPDTPFWGPVEDTVGDVTSDGRVTMMVTWPRLPLRSW